MNKLKKWAKAHKTKIIAGTLFVIVGAGTIICFKQGKKIEFLKSENTMFKMDNIVKDWRIHDLEVLCEEKDEISAKIFSDGLRHGSPLCGQALADLRYYKSAA